MRKPVVLTSALLALLALSSCSTHYILLNTEYPIVAASHSATVVGKSFFFAAGIGQSVAVQAADICKGSENILQVKTTTSFVDGLIGLSGASPVTYEVYCRESQE